MYPSSSLSSPSRKSLPSHINTPSLPQQDRPIPLLASHRSCPPGLHFLHETGGDSQRHIMKAQLNKTIGAYRALFQLDKNQLIIELRPTKEDHILRTVLHNGALPPSFLNIFDDVADLFGFLEGLREENTEVVGATLVLELVLFKKKKVSIDLVRVEVQGSKQLVEKMDNLEGKMLKLQQDLEQFFPRLQEQLREEMVKVATSLFGEQIKKLQGRIAKIQKTLQKGETNQNGHTQGQPVPKTSKHFLKIPRMTASVAPNFLQEYQFQVDQGSLYLDYFTFSHRKITRKIDDEEIYMLASSYPISKSQKVSIKMRVNCISEGLIWVGLLSECKRREQYIGQESNIIQFSLEGSKALIETEKIQDLPFKEFKSGDTIEMQIYLPKQSLQFYKNGRAQPFYEIIIPSSMMRQQIYPYVQMINEGDSISFI